MTTIQRLYSLPNCKLVLEGLSDANAPTDTARPLLSILVNAECHIAGHEKPLSGGREFLESLVAAVSAYAQEFLSGIHHAAFQDGKSALIQLHRVGTHVHRLVMQSTQSEPNHSVASQPTQIDLATVQLFDLVEAVDQLIADTQTLPDLQPSLSPLPKRQVAASEPIAKRAAPAALGASSLAAAAALLFFLPVPEVRRPEPAANRPTGEESPVASPRAIASPTAAASSPPDAVDPSPLAASSSTSSASPSPSASPEAAEAGSPPDPAQVDALLSQAPEITDVEEVRQLTLKLREQLDQAWTQSPNFDEDLIYRVGVAENGDILGFKYVNEASIAHVDKTPLLDLRYNPTDSGSSSEPIAQLRVVFTPGGVVQVSPWHGYPQ